MAENPQRFGPATLREIQWTIEQVKKMVKDGLRRDPNETPQPHESLIVWVPSGGIPARVGNTCYSVTCDAYMVSDSDPDDGEFDLEEMLNDDATQHQVEVFNISNAAVTEYTFCATSLLRSGHRYVVVEPCESDGQYGYQ